MHTYINPDTHTRTHTHTHITGALSLSKTKGGRWWWRCRGVVRRTSCDKLAEQCALLLLRHWLSQYRLLYLYVCIYVYV